MINIFSDLKLRIASQVTANNVHLSNRGISISTFPLLNCLLFLIHLKMEIAIPASNQETKLHLHLKALGYLKKMLIPTISSAILYMINFYAISLKRVWNRRLYVSRRTRAKPKFAGLEIQWLTLKALIFFMKTL